MGAPGLHWQVLMTALTYDDIYGLCEELAGLCGASLQSIVCESPTRYFLDFRLPGQSRWLVLDLTPSRPFIVSTISTAPRRFPRKTPVLNFFQAHFRNLRMSRIEVAQKPDRLVKMTFGHLAEGSENPQILFKCFPHGQEVTLLANGKKVVFPRRSSPPKSEPLAFVEPQPSHSWGLCESWQNLLLSPEPAPKSARTPQSDDDRVKKQAAKIQKTVDLLEEKIATAEAKALEMRSQRDVDGVSLNRLYDEIKKLKKKKQELQERKSQIPRQVGTGVPKREGSFSGLRIVLNNTWELWVGRNASQNDLLLRQGSPHDTWIHLRDYPGAHGLLRGPKKGEPNHADLEYACRVVAILSQSKKNPFREGEALDFIVTAKKFVKKPRGAAPGRVIVEREKVRRIAFKTVSFQAG